MSCKAKNCYNKISKKIYLGVTFHRFPLTYTRQLQWKNILGIPSHLRMKPESDRVCSKHFSQEDFEDKVLAGNIIKRYLKPGTTPLPVSDSPPREDNTTSNSKTGRKKRKKRRMIYNKTVKVRKEPVEEAEDKSEITTDLESIELIDEIKIEPTDISYENMTDVYTIIEIKEEP
uniref:THAP-type domain-containing protein n=1 Tax=Phlebotomus kandelakii TaxID=1109342 RepID=A0A6B2ENT1_9DIPT